MPGGFVQIGSAERSHWLLAHDTSGRHFFTQGGMPANAVTGLPR